MDIIVFTIDGTEHRVVRSWLLGVTHRRSWIDAAYFTLVMHFGTVGPVSTWVWDCVTWDTVEHVLSACGLLETEKGKEGETSSDVGEGN